MTINHCPLSDFTPTARHYAIKAIDDRIANHHEFINRKIAERANGNPLWSEWIPSIDSGYILVPRFFHVWDGIMVSPYEIIADAEARLIELKEII